MKTRKIIIIICALLCVVTVFMTAFLGVKYNNAFAEFEKFETYYCVEIPRGLIKNYFFKEYEHENAFYCEIYLTKHGYENFIKQFDEKTNSFWHVTKFDSDVELILTNSTVNKKAVEFIKNKDNVDIYIKSQASKICFCLNRGVCTVVPNKIGYTLVVSGDYSKE